MPVTLYHFAPSAPSRAALMSARALGLDVNVKVIDLFKKEQLKEEFIKINPQHCIPTIEDDGFAVWESRAIISYLVSKYGKDDALYPKDLQKRASVDRLLYFDACTIFPRVRAIAFPVLFLGETTITQDKRDSLNQGVEFLEKFLEGKTWVAGTDHYTVADISLVSSVLSFWKIGLDLSAFPRVQKWLKDCQNIPGYDENVEGATMFGNAVRSKLAPGTI